MKRMVVEFIATTSTSCGGAVGTKHTHITFSCNGFTNRKRMSVYGKKHVQ